MSVKRLLYGQKPSKKGITLVEVLIASALLVVFAAAIISIVALSDSLIGKNVKNENEIARAEGIADVLMTAISKGETDTAELESLSGARYVSSIDGFSSEPGVGQFTFNLVTDQNGIEGYRIYVSVNGSDGMRAGFITAFASAAGRE